MPFKCLHRNKDGKRCWHNVYIRKNKNSLTCFWHRNEQVDFKYNEMITMDAHVNFVDVATLIARFINDPTTFLSFAQVSRSTAKACHNLQLEKRKQFIIENARSTAIYPDNYWKESWLLHLPDGRYCDPSGNDSKVIYWVTHIRYKNGNEYIVLYLCNGISYNEMNKWLSIDVFNRRVCIFFGHILDAHDYQISKTKDDYILTSLFVPSCKIKLAP